MNVDYTDVNAKRDWLHPWTGEISYLENRSFSILGANVTLRTVSHDEITLRSHLLGRETAQVEKRNLQGGRDLTGVS